MTKSLVFCVAVLIPWPVFASECDSNLSIVSELITRESEFPDPTGERAAAIALELKTSDLTLAADYARRAVERAPKMGVFSVLLAEILVRDGQWDEGLQMISEVLARRYYRGHWAFHLKRLRWAWQAERFEDIVRWTEQKHLPSSLAGFRYAALVRLERPAEAVDAWERVLPSQRQELTKAGWVARLEAMTKGPELAVSTLWLETRGTHPVLDENVDYVLAKLLEADPERALEALNEAVRRRDWYYPLLETKAALLRKLGRGDEAELALSNSSDRVQQLQGKAQRAKARGDFVSAIRLIDEAISIKPKSFILLKLKINLLTDSGRAAEAIKLLEARRAERPEMSAVLTAFLSSIYYATRKFGESEASADAALALDANSAVANFVKAQLLKRRRQPLAALPYASRAFAVNAKPKYERLIVLLLIELGQFDAAERALERSVNPNAVLDLRARLLYARGDDRGTLELLSREPRDTGRLRLMARSLLRLNEVPRSYAILVEALTLCRTKRERGEILTHVRALELRFGRVDLRTREVTDHLESLDATTRERVERHARTNIEEMPSTSQSHGT